MTTSDIMRLASPHWIKYISCKKCHTDYEAEIATEPCARCGGYDFEQFDLILHKMTKQNGGNFNG